MAIQIKRITLEDKKTVLEIVQTLWGDEAIIVHGEVFHTSELAGLKATEGDKIIGILHYQLEEEECEILTLASIKQKQGVGSSLIAEVEKIAKNHGCRVLNLTTTNDNLHALGFYQRRGFHLAALYPGQITITRKLKPTIPEIGNDNIPIRDELRLEKNL